MNVRIMKLKIIIMAGSSMPIVISIIMHKIIIGRRTIIEKVPGWVNFFIGIRY